MVDWPTLVLVAIFGLCVGSFLNVCIHRLPIAQSLVWPGSYCPGCGKPLRWYDNVPLIGYVLLHGRCRSCGMPISPIYPAVEAATATVFVGGYLLFGLQPLLVSRLLFACAMIVLFMVDLQHRILPNLITLPGVVVGFVLSLFLPPGWRDSLLGIVTGGGILLLIAETYYRVRKEEGLGMGDVKMLAMIGAFLGWRLMLVTLVLSSFMGSIIGLSMIALKKGDMKYALPFGTFLAVAALVSSVAGDALLKWYMGFY